MSKTAAKKIPLMGPIRVNLEAFGVAILAAVLLKWFCLEAYQIPTSSMQPTLMGDQASQVFDRILVDKLLQTFREPKRWDITVFRYPLQKNQYNTLSSALMVLALDAYTSSKADAGLPVLQALGFDGKQRTFGEAFGVLQRGVFLNDDQQLSVTPPKATPSWYVLSQTGYDTVMPKAVQDQGIEIVREYLDARGQPITQAELGQEITVRLRLRALGADAIGSIAIVDLLPGGFEPVVQLPPPAADSGENDDEADGDSSPPVPTLALPGSTLYTEHVEQREDRIVVYASAGPRVTEFRYKIRPSNPGTFVIPPAYAESMYERSIYTQGGPAGNIEVK